MRMIRQFEVLKRLCCPPPWETQSIGTFRWKMLQVAGRIVRLAGRWSSSFVVGAGKLGLLEAIRWKSFELCVAPEGNRSAKADGDVAGIEGSIQQ